MLGRYPEANLRVRDIHGIRGVSLKAEPSGRFLALVPNRRDWASIPPRRLS